MNIISYTFSLLLVNCAIIKATTHKDEGSVVDITRVFGCCSFWYNIYSTVFTASSSHVLAKPMAANFVCRACQLIGTRICNPTFYILYTNTTYVHSFTEFSDEWMQETLITMCMIMDQWWLTRKTSTRIYIIIIIVATLYTPMHTMLALPFLQHISGLQETH